MSMRLDKNYARLHRETSEAKRESSSVLKDGLGRERGLYDLRRGVFIDRTEITNNF